VPRLVVAYHKPGDSRGSLLIDELVSRVETPRGVEVVHADIEEAAEHCDGAGAVAALLPARGGHLEVLASEGKRVGCRVYGPLPTTILASYVAEMAGRNGCRSVAIGFWRAKRFDNLQLEDMGRAAEEASRVLGARVALQPYTPGQPLERPRGEACIVIASLLPGRLPRVYEQAGWRVAGRYILESRRAVEGIARWLSLIARSL
jgi:hypothetical protein